MEVDTCRERLSKFCVGCGLDVGFGGAMPIVPSAITIDRSITDLRRAYTSTPYPTNLIGDAADLYWFKDGILDYVFSSHVLEDFTDTTAILCEWLRPLKVGGRLVLFLPDQLAYELHCTLNGSIPNQAHVHKDFSLTFLKSKLPCNCRVVHELYPVPNNAYSFDLVLEKV